MKDSKLSICEDGANSGGVDGQQPAAIATSRYFPKLASHRTWDARIARLILWNSMCQQRVQHMQRTDSQCRYSGTILEHGDLV